MIQQTVSYFVAAAAVSLSLGLSAPVYAGAGHDEPRAMGGMDDHAAVADAHAGAAGGHGHRAWAEPPARYRQTRYERWNDHEAAERGEKLFNQQCAACHGGSGTGNGPVAASLQHPPADLTNHFHQGPGEGDAYLFWRISEGGQVEPFKSAQSAMPAFKETLSERERWEVLTYVHQAFHQGFKDDDHAEAEGVDHGQEKQSH